MKKILLCVAAGAMLSTASAQAQEFKAGDLLVRGRVLNLQSANSDATGLGLSLNGKVLGEIDLSYFFSGNISAELGLTVPQSQKLYSRGAQIGTLSQMPSSLTAQYHFDTASSIKPYVGVGVNYTRFSSVNILNGAVDIDHRAWGLVAQAGFDVPLAKDVYLNVDLKKLGASTAVYASGSKLGTFKIDPWLIGVGMGWRF